MGLVDPSLLSGGAVPDYMGALQQGRDMRQKNIDYKTRNDDEARKDAARNAFQKAAQGQDITTPEGMKTAITGLAQAGYAEEAARVYEAHKELFQKTPNSFTNVETDQGNVPFNQQKGTYGDPLTVNGQPVFSPAIAEKKKKEAADFDFGKSIPSYDTELSKIGSNMTKRDLLASKILADHPESPKAERYISSVVKPATLFNPAMGQAMLLRPEMSAENRISSENQKQTGDYEVAKRGAVAFKADYDNYKKALASGDKQAIKIAQQGMVDKYITTSTGKSTGDAQFKNFIDGQGVTNAMQNLGDKLMNGSMAPQKIFDAMNDITMSTAMKMNEKAKQANAMTRTQVARENKSHGFGIDAESLITHPEDMLSQDSAAFSQPAQKAAVKISSKAEFDKLPSGTTYIGPSGHTAVKP